MAYFLHLSYLWLRLLIMAPASLLPIILLSRPSFPIIRIVFLKTYIWLRYSVFSIILYCLEERALWAYWWASEHQEPFELLYKKLCMPLRCGEGTLKLRGRVQSALLNCISITLVFPPFQIQWTWYFLQRSTLNAISPLWAFACAVPSSWNALFCLGSPLNPGSGLTCHLWEARQVYSYVWTTKDAI